MSSILTNNSAMVALQTLNSINKNLATTQNEISTGKTIASAKDGSAIWAISMVMQSDVDGFDAISSSLALGQSTVAVGRNAAESVTDLLGEMKEKIVAAQEDNVDRDKLQTEVASLRDQISGIVGAAQFNGQNLLSNTSYVAGEESVDVLASLDRASDGSVASSNITVGKADLGTGASAVTTTYAAVTSGAPTGAVAANGGTANYVLDAADIAVGNAFRMELAAFGGAATDEAIYVAREGDTAADIAAALAATANFRMEELGIATATNFSFSASGGTVTVTNNSATASTALAAADFQVAASAVADDNTIGGGLELLGELDVSTANGAAGALSAIEYLTQVSIEAAADFGTSEKRMDIQMDFVSKLTDSMKSGIGALVDADMEEASARLQALQVQQQLGIQSLSIANQAPQQLLSLFR